MVRWRQSLAAQLVDDNSIRMLSNQMYQSSEWKRHHLRRNGGKCARWRLVVANNQSATISADGRGHAASINQSARQIGRPTRRQESTNSRWQATMLAANFKRGSSTSGQRQTSRISSVHPGGSNLKPFGHLTTRVSVRQTAVVSLMFAILLVPANELLWCHCDTAANVDAARPVPAQQRSVQAIEVSNRPMELVQRQAFNRSHKESGRLLNSLAKGIELQHIKLVSPSIRSLALARPSKFDSDSGSLREEPGSLARISARSSPSALVGDQKGPKKQALKTLDDIMNQHLQSAGSSAKLSGRNWPVATRATSFAGSTAEQDLRQIMLMHELAGKREPAASQSTKSTSSKPSRFEANKGVKVLLSSVAAYLDPVAPRTNSSGPFTARMNAKGFLMGPLLGLGQMLASPDRNKYGMPLGSGADESQASYVLSNAINQPQGYSSSLKGIIRGSGPNKKQQNNTGNHNHQDQDLMAEASAATSSSPVVPRGSTKVQKPQQQQGIGGWIRNGANQLAQSYLQDSFRDLLTLTQLPILSGGPVSTAPSELEPGGKKFAAADNRHKNLQQANIGNRTATLDDILRYAYILGNLGVRRKRDPLKALGPSPAASSLVLTTASAPSTSIKSPLSLSQRFHRPTASGHNNNAPIHRFRLNDLLTHRKIKPRGVMWDMATDPSLAVTVFHLLERASVALPLGFLLMPLVRLSRNPLNGINLGRIIPARASHRSIDYEELAKRIDMMDKILSRALRPSHRESSALSFIKR